MPRKDPMTGCRVMTLDELAASEGTTVGELLEPMYEEMHNEGLAREDEIRRDPLAFYESVLHACPPDEDPPPFVIAEVLSVKASYGFRKSSEHATLRCIDARGGTWTVTAGVTRWDGGRWEPPDEETTVDWQEAA